MLTVAVIVAPEVCQMKGGRGWESRDGEKERMGEICQPWPCLCKRASVLSHDFLFGVVTTASCTFPIQFKAHSAPSSLNLLTLHHGRRQVTGLVGACLVRKS